MLSLKKLNIPLLVLPIPIFALGFLTILSTSPERARDHLLFFVVGYLLYFLVSTLDVSFYRYYWKYIYVFTLAFLIFTYIMGEVRFGSARWLDLGFITIQPSEFAKITLAVVLSSIIISNKSSLNSPISLLKIFMTFVPLFILVFVQPDLGTTLVLLGTFILILFYAGLNKLYFLTGFITIGIFSSPIWELLKDYQKQRILVFLNPALDVLGSGYNVSQALIAVGSGGLMGKGFGRGTQSQNNFLPAHWTDFAFASFSEEWGYVGVFLLLVLFTLLLVALVYVAYKTEDSYASLVSIGVFAVFFIQFFINIGMNLSLLPVTGIPLPFISYGGSSLLSSFILLGLVQSIWTQRKT